MAPSDQLHGQAPATPDKPRILVPERVSVDGLALLASDFEVDVRLGLSAQELLELIPAYHGLIVRSETQVTAQVLAAGKKLRVVARAGVGVDNIDVDGATAQGIIVVNSPAGNIVAAAEHTIALLLATARNVGRADRESKEGKWERSGLVGVEVGRKVIGIVGLGKVGMKVARMCVGLGMRVLAVDPYASADLAQQASVLMVDRLEELLPMVDFLSIHTPLLASTLDLLGEAEFRMMRRTARVLNVARGGVYNEAALLKALDEGWIAGAGLDVFTTEPPEDGSIAARLSRHAKVVSTPHLGASTKEAQENVSLDVCSQVRLILGGGLPTSAVNAPLILPDEYRKLQPFVKLAEKIGSLYTQHYVGPNKGGKLGGRKLELVYQGELASVSNTRPLFAALVKGLVSAISDLGGRDVNIVNATLIAKQKGIVINEVHRHDGDGARDDGLAYASLVTLRSCQDGAGRGGAKREVIEGYVSGRQVFISKLGRFSTASFTPAGTVLILHNYDEPGKIGGVGSVLGRHGINIGFMQVACLDRDGDGDEGGDGGGGLRKADSATAMAIAGVGVGSRPGGSSEEALMILGVDRVVEKKVLEELGLVEGIMDVSLVQL